MEDCWKCGGTGYLPQYKHIKNGECFPCNGTGKMSEEREKEYSKEMFEKLQKRFKVNTLLGINPRHIRGQINRTYLAEFYNRALKEIGEDEDASILPSAMREARDKLMEKHNPTPTATPTEDYSIDESTDFPFELNIGEDDDEFLLDDLTDAEEEEITRRNEISREDIAEMHDFGEVANLNFGSMPPYSYTFLTRRAKELAERHDLDFEDYLISYSSTHEEFDREEFYEHLTKRVKRSPGAEEATEDYYLEGYADDKVENFDEYMKRYGKMYEGDLFTPETLPQDARYGSSIQVMNSDGSTFHYQISRDERIYTGAIIQPREDILTIEEREKYAEKLSNISSRLEPKHLKHIKNPRAFLEGLDELVSEVRSRGFRSHMDSYVVLNDGLLNPAYTSTEISNAMVGAGGLIHFTPLEMQFFKKNRTMGIGRTPSDVSSDMQTISFMQQWYSGGAENYATSAVIRVLDKMGISFGVNDPFINRIIEKYGENDPSTDVIIRNFEDHFDEKENISPDFISAVLKMYILTQASYKKDGTDTITLHRGIKKVPEEGYEPRSIESWTVNKEMAKRFAGGKGAVLTREADVENILFDHELFDISSYDSEEEYVYMSENSEDDFTMESENNG